MEDDDCVIFKGSPLYESLLQSGYHMTENEVESSLKSGTQDVHPSEKVEGKHKYQVKNNPVGSSSRQNELWAKLYEMVFNQNRQRTVTNRAVLQRLQKCQALDEDDADFLDWFIDSTDEKADQHVKTMTHSKWLIIVITPVIISYIYTRFSNPVTSSGIFWMADILTVLFCLYVLVQIFVLLVGTVQNRRREKELARVEEFLTCSVKFGTVLKKALRVIQEAELIARGFTLVSQRNPLSRLEEGKRQTMRQCPALRKLLFTCSRSAIHTFRQKTKQVLDLIPQSPEIEISSGYLAYEPIENYGPCLHIVTEERQTDMQLYNLTDGFSVSALKGISHLMMLHMSEYIKALAVFYHYKLQYTEMKHDKVLKLITELTADITTKTESVQRSIDFHNSSLIRRDREDRQMEEKNEYSDLYVAVHSLDLHLQSALTRVRSLATDIESQMKSLDHSKMSHDQMSELMQPIKAELTSCNSCYSDAITRLEHLSGKSSTQDENEDVKIKPTWKEQDKPSTKVTKMEDYIIVDQVFEAYTDPDEIGLEDTDWELPLTAEEKEKKRREKEEAVRMLSELKSVIKVRAKETEKRETAALNRSKLGTIQVPLDKDKANDIAECENEMDPANDVNVNKKIKDEIQLVPQIIDTVKMQSVKDELEKDQRYFVEEMNQSGHGNNSQKDDDVAIGIDKDLKDKTDEQRHEKSVMSELQKASGDEASAQRDGKNVIDEIDRADTLISELQKASGESSLQAKDSNSTLFIMNKVEIESLACKDAGDNVNKTSAVNSSVNKNDQRNKVEIESLAYKEAGDYVNNTKAEAVDSSDNKSDDNEVAWPEAVYPRFDELRTKSVVTQLGVRRLRRGTMLDDSDSDDEIVTDDARVGGVSNHRKIVTDTFVGGKDNYRSNRNNANDDKNDHRLVHPVRLDNQSLGFEQQELSYVVKEGSNRIKDKESATIDDADKRDVLVNQISKSGKIAMDIDDSHELVNSSSKGSDELDVCDLDGTGEHFCSDGIADDNNDENNDSDKEDNGVLNPSLNTLTIEERLAKLSGLDFNLTSNIALMAAARSKAFVKSEETTFGGDVYGELSESESDS